MSIDEIIFHIFSKFGLGAQVLSLNGFFLLILKESHGGKNLSYVNYYVVNLLLISKLCGHFHPLPNDCVFSQKRNSA